MSEITVIYDGQCQLCRNSIAWVCKKLVIDAVDFHTADLSKYSLAKGQVARKVFVIDGPQRFAGADAVAYLLKARGNKVLGAVVIAFGPVSRIGYRWVAKNRNSMVVQALSRMLAQ